MSADEREADLAAEIDALLTERGHDGASAGQASDASVLEEVEALLDPNSAKAESLAPKTGDADASEAAPESTPDRTADSTHPDGEPRTAAVQPESEDAAVSSIPLNDSIPSAASVDPEGAPVADETFAPDAVHEQNATVEVKEADTTAAKESTADDVEAERSEIDEDTHAEPAAQAGETGDESFRETPEASLEESFEQTAEEASEASFGQTPEASLEESSEQTAEQPQDAPQEIEGQTVSVDEIDKLLAERAEAAVSGDFETTSEVMATVQEHDEPSEAATQVNVTRAAASDASEAAPPDQAALHESMKAVDGDFMSLEQLLEGPQPELPAATGDDSVPEVSESPDASSDVPSRVSYMARLMEWMNRAVRLARRVPPVLQRVCAVINRPLHRLSPTLRNAVGYVGLVTLFNASLLLIGKVVSVVFSG